MDTSRLPSPYHLAAAQSERTRREDHHTTKNPPNIRHPTASRRHLHFDAHDSTSNASNSYRSHESVKIRRKGHGNPSHEPSISASSFPLEEYVDPHTPTSSSRRSNRNVPTISRRSTNQRTLGSRQQTIPSDNRRNQRGFLDLSHNLGRSRIVSSRRSSIASTTNAIPSPASPRSPPGPPPPPPRLKNHIPPHPTRSSPTARHQYDHAFHDVVIPSSSPQSHGSGSRPLLRMGVSAPASVERNRISFQESPPTFPRRTQSQTDSYRERHYPEQHAPPLFTDLRRDRSTDIITLEVPQTPTTPAASSSPHAANRKDLMDLCETAERIRRLVSEIDDMKSLSKVTKRVRLLKRKFQHAYPTYSMTTTSPSYYEHTSTRSPAFAVSPHSNSVNPPGPNIVSTNSLNPPSSTGARSTASATDMELDLWVSRRSQLNSQLECVVNEMKEFKSEIEKRENRAKKIERQIAILMKQQSSNDRELAEWRGKYEERSTTQEKWKKQIRRLNEKIEDREMIINLGSEIESNLVWTASSLDEILSDYEMGWRNWTSADVFAWVCCLDGGRFSRYRHDLKREIIQRNIVGRKLPEVNALVLQCIGISDDTHRQQIIEHRDRLLASHGDSSAHNSYSSLPSPHALVAQTQEHRGGNHSHSSHGISISSRSRSLSHTSANIYAEMHDEKMDESHLLSRRRSRSHSEIEMRKGTSRRNSMSCDDVREEKRRRSRRMSGSNKTKCVICYEYECDRVCIPCGHICICSLGEKCGKHVLAEAKCPLCRAHVEQLVKVFHAS